MRFKKIIAGIVASALTVTSVVITNIVVNAAAVQTLPSGNEQVLYTADLSNIEKTTENYKEMGNVGISNIDPAIMENENVYVKMTFSDLGTSGDDDTPVTTILGWGWDSYSGWLYGAKWYNNYSGEFDVKFVPLLADDTIAAYVSISDFVLDEYNQIGGNLQSGNCSVTEIASLQIVKFVEAEPDENGELPLPSSDILIEELEKYESIRVTYNPTPTADCGDPHEDGSTYCTWSALNIIGKLNNSGVKISDSKKTDWYQPDDNKNFATNEDKEEISVVIPVDDIISLFTNDSDWDDYSLKCILFNQWHLTVAKVTGKPVEETVPATGVTLNEDTLSLEKGETFTLEATVAPANSTDEVVWSSSDEAVAAVDENGEVTAVAKGTATITATAGEASASCEVTVTETVPATSVILNKDTLTLEKGDTFTLKATVSPENSTDKVVWSSDNEAVATVDENGKVTAVDKGTATITATAGEASAECAVTVTIPATGVTLNKTTLTLEKGKTDTLTATVAPENSTDKVVWSSSNKAVATVDENGKVTAVDKGTATITATAGEASAECAVTVTIPATGVTLNKTALTLEKGKTDTLTAAVSPENSTDKVVWSSDNEAVATVDENGKVTAVAKGTAIITATAGKASASCEVTVTVPVTSVTLDKNELSLKKGESAVLTAAVDPDDATDKTVTWESDNEAAATVDENGKVTAVASGTAVITAAAGGKTAECTVTVTNPAEKIEIEDITVLTGKEKEIVIKTTPADADSIGTVTYNSADEAVARVVDGKVQGVKAGTTTITATAGNLTAEFKVTVTDEEKPATEITLNKTSLSLEKGKSDTLEATVEPKDSTDNVVWSSDNEAVATVDQSGKVTAIGGGKAVITAAAGSVSATCEVTVTVPVTSVTLDKNELSLEKGESAVLTATVDPDDATDKTVTWESDNEAAATVDENGKVTAIGGGKAVITAKAGDKSATCTVTVTVPVTSVTLDKNELSLEKGESAVLTVTVDPDDATDKTVTWESDNEAAATVDENGKVTAIGGGKAVITAKAGEKSATCTVTVTVPVTSVTLDKNELSLEKGESAALTATVDPDDATDKTVTWESDNEAAATVDESGKVTAVGGGKAVITAKAGDKSATCTVTVTVPVTSVALDKNELSLEKGESAVLTATVDPDDATDKTVTWESDNEAAATVDESGKVTAIGGGKAVITAKAGDKSATCEVTVTVPVTSVTLDKNELSLEKDETAVLTATVDPDDATDKTVTWTSSDETVATVVNGEITAVAAGTATITAASNADETKKASCTVKVTEPEVTEPDITEPDVTEPDVTEPDVTEPDVTEPDVSEPDVTEPDVSEPDVTEPDVSEPDITEPDVSEPDITQPVVTKPDATEPDVTKPDATEPDATEPDVTEPDVTTHEETAITEGSASGETELKKDTEIKIEIPELNVTLEAGAGTFEEAVSNIIAEVEIKLANASEEEKAAVIAAAIKGIENAAESVSVNNVISVTLKDQDGNIVQPVAGAAVKVTLPDDGKSNYAAYIDGDEVEFIKLTIAGGFASFEAKHFSDYYLVSLSDEAVKAVEVENISTEATTTEPGTSSDSNDDNNMSTGVAIAFVPAVVAAAASILFKKRK